MTEAVWLDFGKNLIHAGKKAETAIRGFCDVLGRHAGRKTVSWSAIQRSLLESIREHAGRTAARSEFRVVLGRMVSGLNAKIRPWHHYREIEGLKLGNISEIEGGNWRISALTEAEIDRIVSEMPASSQSWPKHVEKHMRSAFIGKVHIRVEVNGDADLVAPIAFEVGSFVVNTLRFASVFVAAIRNDPHRNYSDGAQLNLAGAPSDQWHDALTRDLDSGEVSQSQGGDQHRQPLELGKEGLDTLVQHYHFGLLWQIGAASQRTEFEDAILDAVAWIGDAQSEALAGPAILKYWTALEAITTGSQKTDIQRRLRQYIPIFVGQFGGIKPPSKNQVGRLYDHRSDIVHGRLPEQTARTDLHTVAFWAALCAGFALDLHDRGYTTRADVETQSARLAGLKSN